MVQPGETGRLAEVGDSADLAQQIDWLLARPAEAARMGRAIYLSEVGDGS